MPKHSPVNARLDSWKEIADYLKRDTRTAVRWEKTRGLPVHRVPGGGRQAVFAYRQEIDAWLLSQENPAPAAGLTGKATAASGRNGNEHPSGAVMAAHVAQSDRAHAPRLSKWKIFAAGAFVAGIISVYFMRLHAPTAIRSLSFKQLTEDGHGKGALRTDGRTLYFNEVEGIRTILLSSPITGSPIRVIDTPFSNAWLQDLSRDGKTLLFTSVEGIEHQGPLWTMAAQGGKPVRVGDGLCNLARWSPDNRRIACSNGTAIIVMDTDGSNPHTVGSFASPVGQMTWTPDGARLRFALSDPTSHSSSMWEVAANNQTGARPELVHGLPTDGSCCMDWAWTKDARNFAYMTVDAAGKTHLMMLAEGSNRSTELQLKIGALAAMAPDKFGDRLYLMIANAFRGELLTFDPKQRTFQIFLHGLSATFLSFSPDGQWMTYVNTLDNSLWRSRRDGSEALQLTRPPMYVEVTSWSPDGQRIAFTGREPGKPFRIYLVGRDGGTPTEASEGNDNQGGPSWSPDGKTLAYANVFTEETQNGWVRLLDLATRKVEIVPGSHNLRTARWSPDGKYIAALQSFTHELMLLDIRTQRWRTLADSITGDNVNWSSDSRSIYLDSPRKENPVVERVRVADGQRATVVDLSPFKNMPGQLGNWVGLTPDNSPILLHMFTAGEIYSLDWTDR